MPLFGVFYEEQLKKKQKYVKNLLGNFGKVRPIIGMEHPWHYRNKAISTFSAVKGSQLVSGIYKEGTHMVIPVEACLLHHERLDEAIDAVRRAAIFCRYKPYDEDRHTGLIRHVLVRHSRLTDEILAVLVTASKELPGSRSFVKKVRELCPQVSTIVQNINPRSTSAVLGFSERCFTGKDILWIACAASHFGSRHPAFTRSILSRQRFCIKRPWKRPSWMEIRQCWMLTAASAPLALLRLPGPSCTWNRAQWKCSQMCSSKRQR